MTTYTFRVDEMTIGDIARLAEIQRTNDLAAFIRILNRYTVGVNVARLPVDAFKDAAEQFAAAFNARWGEPPLPPSTEANAQRLLRQALGDE